MKFGLENEKFLYDLNRNLPSEGVFSFINALGELDHYIDSNPVAHVTNEFVLNLIEITTEPSSSPLDVLKEYAQNYLLLKSITLRESVTLVPLGSLPLIYQPHVIPRICSLVQNSILDNKLQSNWMLSKDSPLTPAGNCAGMHVHCEIETPADFLSSNRELQDKFNLGLMLTPMIAFASSPYFFGVHEANSMRGQKYFYEIYKDFPEHGGLPQVMNSSLAVLEYFHNSSTKWLERGCAVGLPRTDMEKLTNKKGASWNPIRWNKCWNTVELRCFDSDRFDLDAGKFIWACGAFSRVDLNGEGLQCEVLTSGTLEELVERVFEVNQGKVSILPTHGIQDIFKRAVHSGLGDPIVFKYLSKLSEFIAPKVTGDSIPFYESLLRALIHRETSSDILYKQMDYQQVINHESSVELIKCALEAEKKVFNSYIGYLQ